MLDRELIGAGCLRVARLCESLQEAHEVHGVEPGRIVDMTSTEYHVAAAEVCRATLSEAYLGTVAITFGEVSSLMDQRARSFDASDPQWQTVRDFFRAVTDSLESDRVSAPPEASVVEFLARPTPGVMRFDLLAALVTRHAVADLLAAVRHVMGRTAILEPEG